MSNKYKVTLSIIAKEDLKNIISYIKNNLKEPSIAIKYSKIIKKEIESLKYFPQKNAIIDDSSLKDLEVRKLVIKNYIAFYKVNEKSNLVTVERILYGASDWIEKI